MSFHLRSQYLAEILAELSGPLHSGSGAEKRRAVRVKIEAKILLWLLEGGVAQASRTVLSRDLSYSGMGILSTKPISPGQQAIVRLPRKSSDPVLVLCQVTQSRELADDLFAVGLIFENLVEHRESPTVFTGAVPNEASSQRKVVT